MKVFQLLYFETLQHNPFFKTRSFGTFTSETLLIDKVIEIYEEGFRYLFETREGIEYNRKEDLNSWQIQILLNLKKVSSVEDMKAFIKNSFLSNALYFSLLLKHTIKPENLYVFEHELNESLDIFPFVEKNKVFQL
jgi:hypothetical protein